jgi:endoglucanase
MPPTGMLRSTAIAVCLLTALVPGLYSCGRSPQPPSPPTSASPAPSQLMPSEELLRQSWLAYRDRFIQADGRVIDREAADRSTSEGQAYAMLRAVMMDDPATFERILQWSENNLRRRGDLKNPASIPLDQLWAWQWGRAPEGALVRDAGSSDDAKREKWGILDVNFASDADIDAITALILAQRRWRRPEYLQLARNKLRDLWQFSTLQVGEQRYLLPGPSLAFRSRSLVILNPSYLAPYAFRLFAQVDQDHNWNQLISSSYQVLQRSAQLSQVGLPSDWVGLDTQSGQFVALNQAADKGSQSQGSGTPVNPQTNLISQYSFDAYRVWWRIALDSALFDAPEAKAYLTRQITHLRQSNLPATLDLQGQPRVSYESLAQYGMLYSAFRQIDPQLAGQIYQKKLAPKYQNGFWEGDSAYYTQNLVWLGLAPPEWLKPLFIQPQP